MSDVDLAAARQLLADWKAPLDTRGFERMTGGRLQNEEGVLIGWTPAGWLIVGVDPGGVTQSGCRDDLLSLARDMQAMGAAHEARRRGEEQRQEEAVAASLAMARAAEEARLLAEEEEARIAEENARHDEPEPEPEGADAPEDAGEELRLVEEPDPIDAEVHDIPEPAAPEAPEGGPGAGIMVEHDDVTRLRNELLTAIDEHEQTLVDAYAPESQEKTDRHTELNHKLFMGALSDLERAELNRLERERAWALTVGAHANALKAEVRDADMEFLVSFDVSDGWPSPPM